MKNGINLQTKNIDKTINIITNRLILISKKCKTINKILYYKNGNIRYEGGWKDNKCNGNGISYDYFGNIRYEGEWLEGKPNGNGTSYNENGNKIYGGG